MAGMVNKNICENSYGSTKIKGNKNPAKQRDQLDKSLFKAALQFRLLKSTGTRRLTPGSCMVTP